MSMETIIGGLVEQLATGGGVGGGRCSAHNKLAQVRRLRHVDVLRLVVEAVLLGRWFGQSWWRQMLVLVVVVVLLLIGHTSVVIIQLWKRTLN